MNYTYFLIIHAYTILEKQDAKDMHGKLVFLGGYLCGSLRVFHSPCLPRVQIPINLFMCWFALLWTRKILIRHFQRHQLTSSSGVLRSLFNIGFVVCRWSLSAMETLTISRVRPPRPLTMYSVGLKKMVIEWLEYLLLERPVFGHVSMLTEWEEIVTKDEAVSLKNPAKVRWDIFLHATTMCSKKTKQYIPVFY